MSHWENNTKNLHRKTSGEQRDEKRLIPCYVGITYEEDGDYMVRHHYRKIFTSGFPKKQCSDRVDVEPALAHIEKHQRNPEIGKCSVLSQSNLLTHSEIQLGQESITQRLNECSLCYTHNQILHNYCHPQPG